MAQYVVLIYEDETAWANAGTQEFERMLHEHQEFGKTHSAVIRGGNALESASTATSLRNGSIVTDGAFAETKEALGGYYLIEVADLDEALAVAKQVPAPFGGVEVRPVRTFD